MSVDFLKNMSVAVTTPFADDLSIKVDSLEKHLKFLMNEGIEAIFLGGTTGEFETLTLDEKKELLTVGREIFHGAITFNVTSCSLLESLELTSFAEANGADAVTALPPFYRKRVGDEGVVAFFNTIANSTKLPFIAYNFTNHTQNEITAEMMSEINAVAIKDSDKNLNLIPHVALYLSAGDSIIAEAVEKGAEGIVSVQGNYRPREVNILFKTCKSDTIKGHELQGDIAETSVIFRKNKQIARIKSAIRLRIPEYPQNVRLPLIGLTDVEQLEIENWYRGN